LGGFWDTVYTRQRTSFLLNGLNARRECVAQHNAKFMPSASGNVS